MKRAQAGFHNTVENAVESLSCHVLTIAIKITYKEMNQGAASIAKSMSDKGLSRNGGAAAGDCGLATFPGPVKAVFHKFHKANLAVREGEGSLLNWKLVGGVAQLARAAVS